MPSPSRLLVLASVAVALAAQTLPAPSGKFAVGRMEFDWTDTSRPEMLSQKPDAHRELMVYVWYPARNRGGRPAPYFPRADRIAREPQSEGFRSFFGAAWPRIVAGTLDSHAIDSAPAASAPKQFPVLLFSHGFGVIPFAYTALIEDLVSHGYIVASIAHTYELSAIAFPDGRVAQLVNMPPPPGGVPSREGMKTILAWERGRNDVWAADMRFVIDRLASTSLAGRMDMHSLGAVGHSIGGRAVARACQLDPRIRACANLDGASVEGAFLNYPGATSPTQPFLFLTAPPPPPPTDEQLAFFHETRADWDQFVTDATGGRDRQLAGCGAGSYHVTLNAPGFEHMSFTDSAALTGTPGALRNLQLAAMVTREFFDKVLRHSRAPLLDGPPREPQVEIRRFPH